MIFSKIAGDISKIAGDLAISEQSVKKIIIPALNLDPKTYLFIYFGVGHSRRHVHTTDKYYCAIV
jgi:hypothetical protein